MTTWAGMLGCPRHACEWGRLEEGAVCWCLVMWMLRRGPETQPVLVVSVLAPVLVLDLLLLLMAQRRRQQCHLSAAMCLTESVEARCVPCCEQLTS